MIIFGGNAPSEAPDFIRALCDKIWGYMSNFSITAWTTHPYMTNLLVIMEVVCYECYICMRYVVHIL